MIVCAKWPAEEHLTRQEHYLDVEKRHADCLAEILEINF